MYVVLNVAIVRETLKMCFMKIREETWQDPRMIKESQWIRGRSQTQILRRSTQTGLNKSKHSVFQYQSVAS